MNEILALMCHDRMSIDCNPPCSERKWDEHQRNSVGI